MSAESMSLVSMICTIIGAVTGLGGIFIGGFALKTWWKEMKGKDQYDTARRLIRAAYKARNAFAYVRHSADVPYPDTPPREKWLDYLEKRVKEEKWPVLEKAMEDLDIEAIDAEILLGHKVEQYVAVLRSCKIKLYFAIDEYFRFKRNPEQSDLTPAEQHKVIRKIYASDSNDDPLSQEIARAIKAIEDEFRPWLRLNLIDPPRYPKSLPFTKFSNRNNNPVVQSPTEQPAKG